ncbi:MAG: triose-phosphate isomerase [Candidatus Hydrogenedentota bacterium]
MRTPIIAGNWKMNLLSDQAVKLARTLRDELDAADDVECVVCPVATVLRQVSDALSGSRIAVGGQNCYTKENGAYTGELSPQMLRDAGCDWVIIGHSERREYFGEGDVLRNEKLRYARASDLNVMFCVGETLAQRQKGEMDSVLRGQVTKGMAGLSEADFEGLVVAYEPVWAIGTGVTATPEQAQEAHAFVRGLVAETYNETLANALRIQYGGSVKADNAAELLGQPDVDGALVGGASLKADGFAAIVRAAQGVSAHA